MRIECDIPDEMFNEAKTVIINDDKETMTTSSITFYYIEKKDTYPKVFYELTIKKGIRQWT